MVVIIIAHMNIPVVMFMYLRTFTEHRIAVILVRIFIIPTLCIFDGRDVTHTIVSGKSKFPAPIVNVTYWNIVAGYSVTTHQKV